MEMGFAAPIGQKLVDGAELRALRFGLNCAWEQRFEKITIELDFRTVVRRVNGEMEERSPFVDDIF